MTEPVYTMDEYFMLRDMYNSFSTGNPNEDTLRSLSEMCSFIRDNDTHESIKKRSVNISTGYSIHWIMYEAPFEKMPLFLNHGFIEYRIISRWRLKVGR